MAEEQSGFGISGTSIVSILAAALLAGYAGHNLLLKDKRAPVAPSNTVALGLQQIDARLWEDPLFAAEHFAEFRRGGETVKDQPACARAVGSTENIERLIVVVPGGPYEQAAETRRRTRYAVISALHSKGYDPVDPEHIGCFNSPDEPAPGEIEAAAGIADPRPSSPIPFETFRNDTHSPVAVAWFDENRLRGRPDAYYTAIGKAEQDFDHALGLQKAEAAIKLIGPYSTRVLYGLAKAQDHVPAGTHFTLYNYSATSFPKDLPYFQTEDCRPVGGAPGPHSNPAVKLCQIIDTDTTLAKVLNNEIRARASGQPRVALIYEADSIYGRNLKNALAESLAGPDKKCTLSTLTYLRGLDGSLPSLAHTTDTASDTATGSTAKDDTATQLLTWQKTPPYEQAEGNAQLDYLERLPTPLHRLENCGPQKDKFTAIGLLGTDVYDKLLLLRALKPRFPYATFFTTDLDAGLFDPSEFAATRNLVVASSFGLRPSSTTLDAEQDIPTFRDSYQTAAFIATRLALQSGQESQNTLLDATRSKPALFEIGRWGAFPLDAKDAAPTTSDHDGQVRRLTRGERLGCWVLGVAGGLFALFELGLLGVPFLTGTFLAIAALGLVISWGFAEPFRLLLTQSDYGEPVSFNGGISIWPIIFMRIIGVLFCLFAIWRVIDKLRRSASRLEDGFFLRTDATAPATPLPGHATSYVSSTQEAALTFLHGVWAAIARDGKGQASIYDSKADDYTSVANIWVRLHPWTMPGRLIRAAFYTLLSALLFVLLCCILGEGSIPARGTLARNCYVIVTHLNLLTMQYLVMLVFDATSFSSYFVKLVRNIKDSKWPRGAVARYRLSTGLQGRPLADWIDIHMIAQRTQTIIELMYFPFIALAIFTVSQSAIFDDVPISIPILALTAIGFGLLLYIAIRLRSEAERIRQTAVENFEEAIRMQSRFGKPRCLTLGLNAIQEFKKGAFAGLRQQPLVRAILLPLSSLGGSAILQQLLGP